MTMRSWQWYCLNCENAITAQSRSSFQQRQASFSQPKTQRRPCRPALTQRTFHCAFFENPPRRHVPIALMTQLCRADAVNYHTGPYAHHRSNRAVNNTAAFLQPHVSRLSEAALNEDRSLAFLVVSRAFPLPPHLKYTTRLLLLGET